MVKSRIILIYTLFILISCETTIKISDIESKDDISYYQENKYTGLAIQEDENGDIRVEEKYNNGIKYYTKLFYTNGSIQSEWIYGNSSISVTRFYKNGMVESKENFTKLLELMQYKRKKIKDSKEEFFTYQPKFTKSKSKKNERKISKDNPFGKLSELRFR